MKNNKLSKKIECMVFMLLIFCISHLLAEPCGDVNSDSSINIVDALLIAQYYVGLNPENFDQNAADVNADGSINIVDALLIAQLYVGLITELPGCAETPTPTPDDTQEPTPQSDCSTGLIGWAAVSANGVNTTTGGGNASPVTVTTFEEFRSAAQDSSPQVIIVSGTIRTTDGDGYGMKVASNKTIMGANNSATIYGGIEMNGVSNVIIQNLNFQGVYPNSGPGDTIASKNSHHIWYDHLALWDADDGLLDITRESSYQTVSWCKFYYTNSSNGHRLASLNGSGGGDHPEDWGNLKVTYHHNWWGKLVTSRMPRVMYGQGHQFNNYFNSPGNGYCIGVGSYGSILVENNYFKEVNNPHQFMYDVYMYAAASGNIYDNCSGAQDTGEGGSRHACPDNDCTVHEHMDPGPFTPPYDYTLDPAAAVPNIVTNCAGPQ